MNFGDLILVFFRFAFGLIDSIVFWLINVVYNLLISLAETTVINDDIIEQFTTNIYALIGVFMLFKVSFSILSYLVNPDEFSDKTRGASKLVSNTLITLVLLVVVPWIFSQAYNLQSIILKDNTIGKIFSSVGAGNTISYSYNAGATMAYDVGTAFLFINESNYLDDEGEEVCEGIHTGTIVYEDKGVECKEQLGLDDTKFTELLEFMSVTYQTKNGILYFSSSSFILGNLLDHVDTNGDFIFTYHFGISTIVGGFVAWILFMFCFDVAVRSVKLGFLEMIAPVPILSRLDPKKGTEVFNKWLKTVLSTFLDLFIRLLAIYFAIFVIAQVSTQYLSGEGLTNNATGENIVSFDPFFHVFIILGALLFAKQMPKLVKDLTGLDLSGNFTLNPMKKLSEVPLVGKAASKGLGNAVDFGKRGAQALGGMAWDSDAMKGIKGAKTGFDNYATDRKRQFNDTEFGRRVSGGDAYDKQVKAYDDIMGSKKAIDTELESIISKNQGGAFDDISVAKNMIDIIKNRDASMIAAAKEAAKNEITSNSSLSDAEKETRINNLTSQSNEQFQAEAITKATSDYFSALTAKKEELFNKMSSGETEMSQSIKMDIDKIKTVSHANAALSGISEISKVTYSNIKDLSKSVESAKAEVVNSQSYKDQKARQAKTATKKASK